MSAPTPVQQTLRSPRRSTRRQKRLPFNEDADSGLTSSETDLAKLSDSTLQHPIAPKPREDKERRKPHVKKTHENPNMQTTIESVTKPNHSTKQDKVNATPSKQAYAASTFLNSPAPSTLPIPSFYSKSVPTRGTESPSIIPEESTLADGLETDTTAREAGPDRKRDSTPLDFLFDAARKARSTPRGQSPVNRSNVSLRGDSPYNRSPAPREADAVFPFELDESDSHLESDVVASSTPFKERIEALRPRSSPSQSSTPELDRKAKAEALKKLLMNSQPPRAVSASPQIPDPNNPFNARPPQPHNLHHPQPHYWHRSGPSTPAPVSEQQPPFPSMGLPGHNNIRGYAHQGNAPSSQRPPSSQLRNIYQPYSEMRPVEPSPEKDQPGLLISTAHKHDLRSHSPRQPPPNTQYHEQIPKQMAHRASPSAQQLEDDLRRVLKLDLASKG